MVEWRTQRFMELLTHHGGVTNEFVSSESTFEANRHRKRVHAYSTLITGGKGAPHPQLRANAPGPSPVNELNGSNRAHSLPHVRRRLQNRSLLLSGSGFLSDPCAVFQSNGTGQRGSNLRLATDFDLSARIFIIIFPIRSPVRSSFLSSFIFNRNKRCRDHFEEKEKCLTL